MTTSIPKKMRLPVESTITTYLSICDLLSPYDSRSLTFEEDMKVKPSPSVVLLVIFAVFSQMGHLPS